MKKLLLALTLSLLPALAQAQCNGVFPNNTICGNISGAGNLPRPVPNSALTGVPGGSAGQIEFNNSGNFGGFTASGDAAINTSTGVVTIQPGVVTGAKIASSTVANGNMAANSVGTSNIIANAATNAKLAAGAINTIKSSLDGSTITDNLFTTLLNATCVAAPSACVTALGYANPIWYGADPTGSANSATAINSALSGSKLVQFSPGGTYRVTATVALQPNQRMNCAGSTIIQGNSANLSALISFATNTANNSSIDHCVIDGNSSNNTIDPTVNLVVASSNSFISVTDCTLQNAPGGNIVAGISVYLNFSNNYITNGISYGIAVFNNVLATRSYATIANNIIIGPMLHLIQIDNTDSNLVFGNRMLQGLATTGTVINVSGTAITWVSGPNFSTLTKGQVIVANGGTEFPIASINSSTSVTSTVNGGTLTGVAAAFGGGDVMSMTSTSYNRITGNFISGGATGGIVLSNQGGALGTVGAATSNLIENNNVENSGFAAIAIEAPTALGSPAVSQTSITGNNIISPGRTGTAGTTGVGIQLSSAANLMVGVIVADNYLYDPFAFTGGYWLSGTGSANATNFAFSNNVAQGFANGNNMSGYPTVASTPIIKGISTYVTDANACTTWGAAVTGGGAAFCEITYNGTNFTVTGK